MSRPKDPVRKTHTRQDLGGMQAIKYNDAAGADKVILIQPAIKRTTALNEIVGAGKYVKVNGASYTLDLLGSAYDPAQTYQKGDVVSNGGRIYRANEDQITGAFDVTKWTDVAPKQIAGIPISTGDVVTTGRWHNTVTTAGWLVDDDSDALHYRVRD